MIPCYEWIVRITFPPLVYLNGVVLGILLPVCWSYTVVGLSISTPILRESSISSDGLQILQCDSIPLEIYIRVSHRFHFHNPAQIVWWLQICEKFVYGIFMWQHFIAIHLNHLPNHLLYCCFLHCPVDFLDLLSVWIRSLQVMSSDCKFWPQSTWNFPSQVTSKVAQIFKVTWPEICIDLFWLRQLSQ